MQTPASEPPRILVVDDDASIRGALGDYLAARGYEVRVAEDAAGCDQALSSGAADLIILDVMMPGEDGLSLCRRLASRGLPILMLSALDETADRIVGLELGAWDYLAKPFDPRELLARVRALLRRGSSGAPAAEPSGAVTFAGWRLDVEARALRDPNGKPLALSEGDHAVLAAFVARPGRILTREALLELGRGADASVFDRAVDSAVSRLRRKLAQADAEPLIETVRGVGYRFLPRVSPA